MRKIPVIVFLLAVGAFLYGISPGGFAFYPRCPLKLLTGWSCAGCGLQRAAHAFLHGRFGEALSYNYFLLVIVPALSLVFLAEALPEGRRRQQLRRFVYNRFVLAALVVLALSWTLARNVWGI